MLIIESLAFASHSFRVRRRSNPTDFGPIIVAVRFAHPNLLLLTLEFSGVSQRRERVFTTVVCWGNYACLSLVRTCNVSCSKASVDSNNAIVASITDIFSRQNRSATRISRARVNSTSTSTSGLS